MNLKDLLEYYLMKSNAIKTNIVSGIVTWPSNFLNTNLKIIFFFMSYKKIGLCSFSINKIIAKWWFSSCLFNKI